MVGTVRSPKERFTALDVRALAREIGRLARPRVDKAFEYPDRGWILSFRGREEGRRDLVLEPGRFGAVVEESPPHPERPGLFAQELRRRLAGTTLARVLDPAGERTLELEFVRSDGSASQSLVVEMFGTGNIVLVSEGRVVSIARPRAYAHRILRPGSEYHPAPGRPDPWVASAEWIAERLRSSTVDRVSTLAARVGFGGPLAEELLVRAGWEGRGPAPEQADEVGSAIRRAAEALVLEVDAAAEAFLYFRDDAAVEVSPFRSRILEAEAGVRSESRPTFGRAAFEYFDAIPRVVETPKTDRSGQQRLVRQRDQQRLAVAKLREEADLRAAQAGRILERYQEAEAARSSMDPDGPERGEVVLGDLSVPLERDLPPDASARRLFEEGKRVKSKLAGASSALEATEAALLRAPPDTPTPSRVGRPTATSERPAWFERFRWFLSSEGILVLGGRDASSNDLLVKKHLRAGDRYVHADLHGAASVVVKRSEEPGPDPTEVTLAEAGQFAVAFSKAWRAGHASADAFWVTPEQVSKTAASGEFVARGAWVIHGTKHALRDRPLELALGTQERAGRERWTVGPEPALRAHGKVHYRVTPGEERRRADLEVEISRDLGVERSLLQSLLPAGGISARRA